MGVCAKTIISAQPSLEAEYDAGFFTKDLTAGHMGCRCFEVLGFDVMLTDQRKAKPIEVNHLPSFACHCPLDYDVKHRLINQVLDLTCGQLPVMDAEAYKAMHKKCLPLPDSSHGLLDLPEFKDFQLSWTILSGRNYALKILEFRQI